MEHLKIPEGYSSPLTIRETEVAIKEVKDHFERACKISSFDACICPVVCSSAVRYERQSKRN